MEEIKRKIISMKYKKDDQVSLWSSISTELNKEEKLKLVKDLIEDGVFGYLDFIAEILYDLVEPNEEFIQLLESLYKKIKNDLAAGPFYNLFIRIGETSENPIQFFKFIQEKSTNFDLKVISGLILGGFGKKQGGPVIYYLKKRLEHPTKEEVIAFIRTIMVIYKDKEISAESIEILDKIYDFKEYNIYPEYINLSTDMFNLNRDYFLTKIKDMLDKKNDNINYVLFKNLTYQKLDLSNDELISFIDLAKDSNEHVIDEILHTIKNKNLFDERIGKLFIYWINKDINSRNLDWVMEELSKINKDIVIFFFSNYDKIKNWQFKFRHIIEPFVKSNPKLVANESKKIISSDNQPFVLEIFRTVIGFIYKSKEYHDILKEIYTEVKSIAGKRDYIDKGLMTWLDKKNFENEYRLCVDKVSELIKQLLNRRLTYDFKKISTNLRKYPHVFDYTEDMIKICEKNKEFSPILWLGEKEKPDMSEIKKKELPIEKELRKSYNRSQYWPRAYLNEVDNWLNVLLSIKNEKYKHLSDEKYKKIIVNELKNENSFWSYFSELCIFNRLYNAKILKKIEPSRNDNQLDALISLNERNIFFEITSPMMDRKVTLDFGAVAIGNRSLNIIQKKLQQAYDFLNENESLILAIDISSCAIDEYQILNALHGSLGVTLQFSKEGRFVRDFPSRSDDSISKRLKNHSLLSTVIIFKRLFIFEENWSPRIVLQGNIFFNPHAKNKLSDDELKRLRDIIFS